MIARTVLWLMMFGGRAQFTPLELFSSGEEGVWYDPSDTTTLFQDSAGTTPVTSDGDPVGLMLDKSKGLVLGVEKSSDATIEKVGTATTATFDGLSGTVDRVDGSNQSYFSYAGLQVGSTHLIDIENNGPSLLQIRETSAGGATLHVIPVGTRQAVKVKAPSSGILVIAVGQAAGNCAFDIFSVRELPGNHATQTTSSARPVLDEPPEWFINFDAVDDKHTTTFPNLGTDVTIARASTGVGAVILTGQTIGAGSYDYITDHAGLIIVNRALTAAETASLTTYLNKKAGV